MNEAGLDEQVARVVVGLLQVGRSLDPVSFDCLLGSILTEIQVGLDVVEERAMEESHARPTGPNVIRFPGLVPERNGQR